MWGEKDRVVCLAVSVCSSKHKVVFLPPWPHIFFGFFEWRGYIILFTAPRFIIIKVVWPAGSWLASIAVLFSGEVLWQVYRGSLIIPCALFSTVRYSEWKLISLSGNLRVQRSVLASIANARSTRVFRGGFSVESLGGGCCVVRTCNVLYIVGSYVGHGTDWCAEFFYDGLGSVS